jgi:hypothetical protein
MLRFLPLLAVSACECGHTPADPGDYALPDLADLPEDLTAEPLVSNDGGLPVRFEAGRADAVTAWADCAAILTACLEARGGAFDACVGGVPTCTTAEPWTEDSACCPSACVGGYQAARDAGGSEFDAFIDTFAIAPDCMPGLEEG